MSHHEQLIQTRRCQSCPFAAWQAPSASFLIVASCQLPSQERREYQISHSYCSKAATKSPVLFYPHSKQNGRWKGGVQKNFRKKNDFTGWYYATVRQYLIRLLLEATLSSPHDKAIKRVALYESEKSKILCMN